MKPRIICTIVIVCFFTCLSARAAVFDFTIEGVVTEVRLAPNVSVGDPFIIRYSAGSQDLDPSPTRGVYAASQPMVILPNVTVDDWHGSLPRVYVTLDDPDGNDVVWYEAGGDNLWFDMVIRFPAGMLSSDALPLSLPLTSATSATWFAYDFGPQVRGDVFLYVPEPGIVTFLFTLSIMMKRVPRIRWKWSVIVR